MYAPTGVYGLKENDIICIGSPLVDIIKTVNEKVLLQYDFKPNDAVVATAKHKSLFEDLKNSSCQYEAGGCALNSARVLQWILNIPKVTAVIGSVGPDNYASILRKKLQESGVEFYFENVPNSETGKCAVLLTGQNRSLCTDLGASRQFHLNYLKQENIWRVIQNAKYFYIPAFFLGVSIDCVMEIAKFSRENQKHFLFNLSAPFLLKKYSKEFQDILPFVDVLFGNETEMRELARIINKESSDLIQLGIDINNYKRLKDTSRVTIITRGSEPVVAFTGDGAEEFKVDEIPQEKIQDTNAAGDAFVGGFMAEYVSGCSLKDCIACGNWAAGQTIQNIGCSFDFNVKYKQ